MSVNVMVIFMDFTRHDCDFGKQELGAALTLTEI